MRIHVHCHAGYRGEETPRMLDLGQCHIRVEAIQDRWLAPDHRYFKVLGEDGGLYLIRHDPQNGMWELIQFKKDPFRAIDVMDLTVNRSPV